MFRTLLSFLGFVLISTVASASPLAPCGTATLSSYESSFAYPASLGCSIGVLDYSSFSYHPISNAPSDSSILLTPNAQGFGFTTVSGTPFTSTANETVQFEIDYNILIDPAPILAGADNSLDPPTGNVVVTEYFCNDSQYFFSGNCFPPGTQTLSVGTMAPFQLSSSIIFTTPATSYQEVGILFTLTGASSFDGLDTTTIVVVPEPASVFLMGIALVAGSYTLKKRRKR